MKKIFKVAQIRNLLNQVFNEKMTFSRFVEILNEQANTMNFAVYNHINSQRSEIIDRIEMNDTQLDKTLTYLSESKHNGLNETNLDTVIRFLLKQTI